MKTVKKTLVTLLATLVAVVLPISAFATTTPTSGNAQVAATDDSTVTIHVTSANPVDTLKMYKIVDVSISDSNSLDYEFTDLFKGFLQSATYKDTYGSLTTDTWAGYNSESTEVKNILSDFTIYLKGLSTAPTPDYTATTSAAGTDGSVTGTFTDVGLGQYIILGGGRSTDTRIYRSVTANVVPSVVDSKYVINTEYDLVMKSSLPTISKTVTGVRTEDDIQSASVGDTMTYQLNALVPEFPNKLQIRLSMYEIL
jgi:hypothetical protein